MNRITLEEFRSLPQQEQTEVLGIAGDLIDTVFLQNEIKELIAVERFFVEVHYDLLKKNFLKINAFEYGTTLDHYSRSIEPMLSELLYP